MIIPCKDCLILPICKCKEVVYCDKLHDWALECSLEGRARWSVVKDYLTITSAIRSEYYRRMMNEDTM